jgi:histidine triad (HIT) family protein
MERDPDCIFCKIIAGELPGSMVYEDDLLVAFRDIRPAAPVHVLIVPRRHIPDNNAITEADAELSARMFAVAPRIAADEGIAADGYRLILNTGPHGRQEVPHLHMHLLGGQPMQHPMG